MLQSYLSKFLQMYPTGYPDDKNFKPLAHYITSARGKSGYKHVTRCEPWRSENWRVKFNNTHGRYFTKAKVCEVAYWVAKKRNNAKAFEKGDTVDVMLES